MEQGTSDLPSDPDPEPAPIAITSEMLAPLDRRVDFERGISYLPVLTIILIVVCIAVFIWELATGALDSTEQILAAGALSREAVLKGDLWRPVSAMFLHGGIDHLIGNCLVLYVMGMATEHAFGIGRAIAIYFISGVCGSMMSLAMQPGPSVGASGAIFGLSAAVIVFLYRYDKLFYVRDKRVGFVLLIWAIYTVGTGFLDPAIDNWAHIGGFVGGATLGAILSRRARPDLGHAFDVITNPQVRA